MSGLASSRHPLLLAAWPRFARETGLPRAANDGPPLVRLNLVSAAAKLAGQPAPVAVRVLRKLIERRS